MLCLKFLVFFQVVQLTFPNPAFPSQYHQQCDRFAAFLCENFFLLIPPSSSDFGIQNTARTGLGQGHTGIINSLYSKPFRR